MDLSKYADDFMCSDKLVSRNYKFVQKYHNHICNHHFPVSSILDIGANVGTYCIPLSLLFKCQVHAFEPIKSTYEILKKNINSYGAEVIPYPFGFWSNECSKNLGIPEKKKKEPQNTGTYSVNGKYYKKNGYFKILDEWTKSSSVYADLIKIDAEDAEYEILLTGAETFKNAHSVIIERGTEKSPCGQLLKKYGFKKMFKIEGQGDVFWQKM